jgi:hypothetical protein
MSAARQPNIHYNEKFVEEQVRDHPRVFLGEDLELWEQQPLLGKLRPDLVFIDSAGRYVIVELQLGRLDRVHLYKSLEYRDALMSKLDLERPPRVILFCERTGKQRRNIARIHGLELFVVPKRRFLKKLVKVDERAVKNLVKESIEEAKEYVRPPIPPSTIRIDPETVEDITPMMAWTLKGWITVWLKGSMSYDQQTFTMFPRSWQYDMSPHVCYPIHYAEVSYEAYIEGRIRDGYDLLQRRYVGHKNSDPFVSRELLEADMVRFSKLRFVWSNEHGKVHYGGKLWERVEVVPGFDERLAAQEQRILENLERDRASQQYVDATRDCLKLQRQLALTVTAYDLTDLGQWLDGNHRVEDGIPSILIRKGPTHPLQW